LTGFPDPTAIYQQAMARSSQPGASTTPTYPNLQPHSSLPGSPQFNNQNRLPNSAAQSPMTPTQILNSNMLFPRPSNLNAQDWQQIQCLQQQYRQRAPQLSNSLVNELMRNTLAQQSPTTAQLAAIQPNQLMMSSPPAAAGSSRSGSVSVAPEAPKSNSSASEVTNNSRPNPVEIISLSDDEGDGAAQRNAVNNVS
jgi:hypothetical protein